MDTLNVRVLLVDDDEDEFLLVRRYLGNVQTGTRSVTWASSYEAALEEVGKAPFDICLLDYQLGDRTGIELLRELRARGHDVPVILLTGHASLELDLTAMELGAFDFMEKGNLTPSLLERAIRYAVAAHRARAALRKANEDLERRVQERTAELNRSNQELEQFARLVASDLQEPLRALVSQIEGFRATPPSAGGIDDASANLDYVLQAVRNMNLLIQCVLDYAQVGRQARPLDTVDLRDALAEARAELSGALAESHAEVKTEELPTIRGNRDLLVGLFRNLLDNSIRFRGVDPPRIEVRSERKGNMWLVSVRDNGIGVHPDEANDVFLMFRRGSRHSGRHGLGMGLALCRKIVQYHGGRIWVDGEPDQGSTFSFNIPAE